ncbi:MAG: TraR/DksA C4-type zinc finger protein [bacterium]|nr:TraR/DksA C4-type zinc finger protein [bacterium]
MDEQIKTDLQEALRKKKEELEKQLSSFASKDLKTKGDWDTRYPRTPEGNEEEAADEVEEYSTRLPVEQSLEKTLQDVQNALEKFPAGTYGICEKCSQEIQKERLFALPEARTCVNCAKIS